MQENGLKVSQFLKNLEETNCELDIHIHINIDLRNHSTFKIQCTGNLIVLKSIRALQETIKLLNSQSIMYRLLGLGANQILPTIKDLVYIKLDLPFDRDYLLEKKENYLLPASVTLKSLTAHARKFSLKGWEVFTGVPATLGGAVFMNAGTRLGEIGSLIKSVKAVATDGEIVIYEINEESFSYRKNLFLKDGEVIFEVEMKSCGDDEGKTTKIIEEYQAKRNLSQPLKESTCGCVFKNKVYIYNKFEKLCGIGHYIEILGLKGFSYNGLIISPKHGNFIENRGNASYNDVMELISFIKFQFKLYFNLEIETEVKY
jgi:UDP-N-acetylmuramate dehydrogenase